MKSVSTYLMFLMLLFVLDGCSNSSADNQDLDWSQLDVNFAATVQGTEYAAPAPIVGIVATCTRGNNENVQMSKNSPAKYVPVESGSSFNLVRMDEVDNITTLAGDHNYQFFAYYPYQSSVSDMRALPVDIPSSINFHSDDVLAKSLYVAKSKVTSPIAPVALEFKSLTCAMSIKVPDNVLNPAVKTVLKSLTFEPANASLFSGNLAYSGVYNLMSDQITLNQSTLSNKITVDFGTTGYELPAGFTEVNFNLAPFTVPEEGFTIQLTDMEGKKASFFIMDGTDDAGKRYAAGAQISHTVSTTGESVNPCSSPVKWLVGFHDGTAAFADGLQPGWAAQGNWSESKTYIWTSTQPQATIQYVVSDLFPGNKNRIVIERATNRADLNYSSPAIKGVWTGDYFELKIPVANFEPDTKVTLTLPAYGRGNPIFWNVEYLDGKEWKCNKSTHKSTDNQFEMESTWAIPHGNINGTFEGHVMTHTMTFTNAIHSGYMRIRLTCADGRYTTMNNNIDAQSRICKEISDPITTPEGFIAFVNKSAICDAITVEWGD